MIKQNNYNRIETGKYHIMKTIKNNLLKYNLFTVACIYYLADMLLPIVQYYSNVYINMFFVLVILLNIFDSWTLLKKQLTPLTLIILLTLFTKLQGIETIRGIIIAFYQTTLIFLPILLSTHLILTKNYRLIKKFIFTTLIFLTTTSLTSSYGLIEFPFASRELATGMVNDPNALLYAKKNIGGFTLVYMIPVILPMIFSLYRVSYLKLIIFLFISLPMVFFVFKSQYTIGIISLILVILSSFIVYRYTHFKLIFTVILIFLSILIVRPYLNDFIQEVFNNQPQEVSTRLNALSDKLQGRNSYSETLVGRQNAYMLSINTFVSSPIFGGTVFGKGLPGGHSFILDMLASFGLIGLISLYFFYNQLRLIFYKIDKTQPYYGYMVLSFVTSLFLSALNTSPNIFVLSLFVPIVSYYIKYKKYYGIS